MIAHPFERIPPPALFRSALLLWLVFGALSVILFHAMPLADAGRVVEFTGAGSPEGASAAWAGMPERLRISLAFVVGFDFLYDLVHNNAVALGCIWAARQLRTGPLFRLGRLLAWVLWLDTALNLVENLAILHMMRGGIASPWPEIVAPILTFRTATLALGVVYTVTGAIALLRRPRREGT